MKQKDLSWRLDCGITAHEAQLIGMIIVEFAAIEVELFLQALRSFEPTAGNEPEVRPKQLNGIQFSETLKYWKERVASKAEGRLSEILLEQHTEIQRLQEYRDALVHGLWSWSPSDPRNFTTQRAKKNQAINVTFSTENLQDFYQRIAEVNFKIRYPGGPLDMLQSTIKSGGSIHRSLLMPLEPQAEQAGAGQPATRAESDSEGGDKPQPEAEGRSR